MKDENQNVDLPDLGYEGQHGRDGGANKVQSDQHGPAREHFRDDARDRGHGDIGDHLDRERGSEHDPGIGTGQIISEKGQRDGAQPRAGQGDGLRGEQMAVGAVLQDGQHDLAASCGADETDGCPVTSPICNQMSHCK